MAEEIRVERDGGVASIVLDSGDLNLFGAQAWRELLQAVEEIEDSDARALVWRAEGQVFSGGVDVHVFQQAVRDGTAADQFDTLVETARRLETLEIPSVALVHGVCLTAAFEIALTCDMIWAAQSARFGLVEAVVGLTPGAGGTQRLAERAGPGRAAELVMTGGLYDAETMERWNVVNRVVPEEDLLEKGMRFAHRLADGPTLAHAATKRIIRAVREGGVDRADEITPEQFSGLFASEDLRGAVDSFLSEGPGKATFRGR